uniref:Sushi domain-containing protein n=1 Tax=Buteo japonicus TaxID=224669 RepID=A0A8B9Z055_9AVES
LLAVKTFCLPLAVQPCPMPPEVRNGNHNGQGKAFFTMGMSVTYTCDPGYYLVGNAVVFCKASGRWSQPIPRCEGASVVCPLGSEHRGHPDDNGWQVGGQGLISAPGQTVTFQCHTGYSLQGSAKIFCQEDGSWHPPVPVCIPCKPPPDIPNGKHTGRLLDEFYFGTSVTYTCNRGYPLHGEPSIYCTTRDGKNGEWSGPPPQCGGRVVCARVNTRVQSSRPYCFMFGKTRKPPGNCTSCASAC